MEMNWEDRNCYNYGRFGHIVRHYRNQETGNRIRKGRRLEYGKNRNNGQQRMVEERKEYNLNGD